MQQLMYQDNFILFSLFLEANKLTDPIRPFARQLNALIVWFVQDHNNLNIKSH